MLSLVITIMGIKLRWFRHRLTLEQPDAQIESPVLLRTTSATEFRENCARGVYRQSSGEDALIFPNDASTVPSTERKKTKTSKYLKCLKWCLLSYLLIAVIENYVVKHYNVYLNGSLCLIHCLYLNDALM